MRRFGYDAKHDILKCQTGRVLRPTRPVKHGRFFYSKAKDCARCPLYDAYFTDDPPNLAHIKAGALLNRALFKPRSYFLVAVNMLPQLSIDIA